MTALVGTSAPAPSFAHIAALTDERGTFEHADHATPRREHGYCTDDVARLLVVATREPDPSPRVDQLAVGALRFVARAQDATGAIRNRCTADGRWHGPHGVDDCWGRSLWGLGTAAAHGQGWLAGSARSYFDHGVRLRSPWPRAMAFAALGAAAVVDVDPSHRGALALLNDAASTIGRAASAVPVTAGWSWAEPRLSYANAVLADALVASGAALDRPALVDHGLDLLGWLLDRETVDGHLSVTPVGGAGPDTPAHGFDQQPIEVATMADACARALRVTGDPRWADGVRLAAAWFDGGNDAAAVMWDPATLGGYDGLEAGGPNRNQGAESTLALISTRQQARALAVDRSATVPG